MAEVDPLASISVKDDKQLINKDYATMQSGCQKLSSLQNPMLKIQSLNVMMLGAGALEN